MFSDKIGEKLLNLHSGTVSIREAAREEVEKLIQAAGEGNNSALEALSTLLPNNFTFSDSEVKESLNVEALTDMYIEAHNMDKDAAKKKKKKSKLREVEERILHFCTRPRVSSDVINIFPARPFNILAIMENLRHSGHLILAANHWVTNIEQRDFVPTMTMTAEKKGAQFESKTAEMWAYSDLESKKRLLDRAKIKAADKYASEEWEFLPNWVKKSVAYVHEHPATAIAEKKEADTDASTCECGHSRPEHRGLASCFRCDCQEFKKKDGPEYEFPMGGDVQAEKKQADDTPATINVNEQSQMQQVEGAGEKEPDGEDFKVGDHVNVDLSKLKSEVSETEFSHFKSMLNKELKRGGGTLEIFELDNNKAGLAGWSGSAIMGLIYVPVNTLIKGKYSRESSKEAETGEVKKDIDMEITHVEDLDTGEKITDHKLISEALTTGMDYIVSFKTGGKESKALLSSLDKSKLKVAEPNSSEGKVSPNDILEMVYDKLMENHQHEQLDVNHVEDQELDLKASTISFKYHGVPVRLSLGTNY